MKKPFYKRWWFIVLAIIVILGAIGSMSDDTEQVDTDTTTPTNEQATEKETEKPKEETAQEAKEEVNEETVGKGTPLEVGDVTFTLNDAQLADQVGPSVLPTTASGKYLVLDVTLKNNGNEAITVDSSFFKLTRGEKTYESDSAASMSANQGEDGTIQNSFFLQEVNPDMEITGKVVFDVAPDVAEATDLQLQVQTGFWGTETGTINLK
ncbi:DUF4352 domain-containing protein [Ureibacillus chungkukjangi]|uniref:DUF4352 domain-containing protein n=1 Tax=Ureibacillus chungkukjangi TaxID=1202712 RepID=UPI003850C8A9